MLLNSPRKTLSEPPSMSRAPMLELVKEKWTGWNQPTQLTTEVKTLTPMLSPLESPEALVESVAEKNPLDSVSSIPPDKSSTTQKCAKSSELSKDWSEKPSVSRVSVTLDTGPQSFSLKQALNLLVSLNGTEVFTTPMESTQTNCSNTRKETNTKLSRDTQVLKLTLMTPPSTSQLISLSQLPYKKLSTKTMPTNSKPNLSLKLLMAQLPWRDRKSWKRKVFNFCQISCVMQVVLLSVISNGWRT